MVEAVSGEELIERILNIICHREEDGHSDVVCESECPHDEAISPIISGDRHVIPSQQ